MESTKRSLSVLATVICLVSPVVGETWFTEPRHQETVSLIRDLFGRPTSEWKRILYDNRSLLTDQFFKNVKERIKWGLEESREDDALNFAFLGDQAAELMGRQTHFQSRVLGALLQKKPYVDSVNPVSLCLTTRRGVHLKLSKIENQAYWNKWPSRSKKQRRQKRLVKTVLRTPISRWEEILKRRGGSSLDSAFTGTVERLVDEALSRGENEEAACFALLGDTAASLDGRNFKLGLKVSLALGSTPLVFDQRDKTVLSFPEPAGRPAEWLVPYQE